eukprot:g10961.t1
MNTAAVAAEKKEEEEKQEEGNCPLAEAVMSGREELANELLERGTDFRRRDHDGRTPLHHAALRGHHKICSLLPRKGADKNAQDKQGDSPLLLAVGRGHPLVAKTLLSTGADVKPQGSRGKKALEVAAGEGHVSIIKALRKHGANADAHDSLGDTPLMLAAYRNQAGAIHALLQSGAMVDLKSRNTGLTALHCAAESHNCEAMLALLQRGAFVGARDPVFQFTPLHQACAEHGPGVVKAVELLLEWGVDERAGDLDGGKSKALLKCTPRGACCSKEEMQRTVALMDGAPQERAKHRRELAAEKAKKAPKKAPKRTAAGESAKKASAAARGRKRGRSATKLHHERCCGEEEERQGDMAAVDPALQRNVAEASAALNAVYNGSGPSHKEADRWLQEFQRSQEAWSVSDFMLSMDSAELNVTFFAAQTIQAKIQNNFRELPQESIPSLRDSLVGHLQRWGGAGKSAVITRLCLALAGLALQLNWPDVLKDLTGQLMRGAGGSVEQQKQAARVLLEFMKVLPEEAVNHRIVVPEATREAFLQQLCGSSTFLLSSLEQIAAGPLGAEVMVQETVFQCLGSWVRHVNVPGDELVRNPLLLAAFDALREHELFETAVDLLVEVLRKYKTSNLLIVQLMVPKAMALEAAYTKAVEEEDVDVARGLCRVFTEMGEAYMDLIMAPDDRGQLKLVQLVLMCTANPDKDIAVIPLYFWYRFCRNLETLEPPELRKARFSMFGQCLVGLIGVLAVLMRFPEDVDELSRNEMDDLKRHRYDVADVLRDVCRILGGVECLRQVVLLLKQELARFASLPRPDDPGSWTAVEACLFAIRSMGRDVPTDEETLVPQVVGMLPRLPSNSHVRYTATLIVGKYAEWLELHQEHLNGMFTFLMEGFASPDVMPAATTAIKNVCHSCGQLMGEQVLGLLQGKLQEAKARTEHRIKIKDELELLEGLSYVISTLPPDPAAGAIRRLVEPMATGLQRDGVDGGDAKLAQQELDRLTVVVSHACPAMQAGQEHPVAMVVRELWPVLQALSAKHQSSGQVFEKLCRFFKHAMRTCKEHFEPLLKPLIAHLVGTFSVVPHSPCLYCGSICVTEFGRKGPAFATLLFQMLSEFAQAVFRCLQTLDDFTANPDVVEEFFYLAGRFVDYCPEPLVSNPLLSSVVRCGMVGLQLHHREAQRGVLHCFEEVVGLAMPEFPGGKVNPKAQQFGPTVEQVLRDHGQGLVQELVKCCSGELPSYSIDGDGGSVAGLLWRISVLCPAWLQEWLVQTLGALDVKIADNFQKQELMEKLFGAQADKSRRSFDDAVAGFASACFQNQRSWAA